MNGLIRIVCQKTVRSSRLEAELLEEPTLALTLLVLVLEELASSLEELGLGLWVGEGIRGEEAPKVLDHGGLDGVTGRHAVGVVHDLDEGLDAGTTLDKLLHLRGRLAHGLGDRERSLGHTGHDTVSVGALLVDIIVGLKDHSLLTGVAALEEHDNLSILQKLNHSFRLLESPC